MPRTCQGCPASLEGYGAKTVFCDECKKLRRDLSRRDQTRPESITNVERRLQEAKADRLRRDRLYGRQYTVNGWDQRPGVSTIDRGGALEDA